MIALARFLFVTAASAFALVALGAENAATPKNSPFVPAPATPAASPVAAENYELAAISTIGPKTTVSIYDKAAKKGRWIRVGETSDGIQVLRFDPRREQVVVRIQNGLEKTLSLRTSTSTPVVTTSSLSAVPPPIPLRAVKPESEPAVVADAPPAAAPATPPPAPGTPAYQEHEARMLVSDLLEIGMAQRKAYEDAQRQAAETALKGARPANAPAPTTAGPAPKTPTPQ